MGDSVEGQQRRSCQPLERAAQSVEGQQRRSCSGAVTARGAQGLPSATATAKAKARAVRACGDPDSVTALVGLVSESREDHLKRHSGGIRGCPRCRWYTFGHAWAGTYGSLNTQELRAGPRERVVWIAERPLRWSGTWGLGCTLCADAAARRACKPKDTTASAPPRGRGQHRRLGSVWSRFDVRCLSLQCEHIKEHACYDVHKLAVQAFLRPDDPILLTTHASSADDRLLAGAVPQPADWLRAWRAAKSAISWQTAAQQHQTEHFIAQLRDKAVQERALKSMVLVMREVVRSEKRKWIREATSISLSFDDRKGHKLVMFKCDTPLHHRGASPYARCGIVGCLDTVHGTSLEEVSEDYADLQCQKIMEMLGRFATPLGDARDERIMQQLRQVTKSIVVDGALQKVGQLLKLREMPGAILLCRDPAHMVRIACSDPLTRTGRFEEQHKRLFTAKHALIKDIQYSEKYRPDWWLARNWWCKLKDRREETFYVFCVTSLLPRIGGNLSRDRAGSTRAS